MTIFEKIIKREIPAKIVWEDDDAIAFRDVNPQAPVHVLIVPKRVVPRLADATEADGPLLRFITALNPIRRPPIADQSSAANTTPHRTTP